MVNAVIRPPRAEYALQDLGPADFRIQGRRYHRKDLQVRNARGLTLECSWWQPTDDRGPGGARPCVVYMHGNSSCRLEVLELLPVLLQMGVTVLAFDFAGCGVSEGDTITLGYHERDDASAVIDHLRASEQVSTIALWGRSMGAATALLHGHRDPSIAAMVLDSPFADLEQLAREIVDRVPLRHKPAVLVNAVLRMLRSSARKRAGLDIYKLKPIEHVDACFIPALFVAGADDQFISPHHAADIHGRYGGDKNLVLVAGSHNSRRPEYLMDSIGIFFQERLCAPAGLTENIGAGGPESWTNMLMTMMPGPAPPLDTRFSAQPVRSGGDGGYAAEHDDGSADAELQQALLHSMEREGTVSSSQGGDATISDMAAAFVECATNPEQSTLPDRRSAADVLRGAVGAR